MPIRLSATLPLLGIWAVAATTAPSGNTAHGAATLYGPKLALSYENLFNDMDLVKAGQFGYTRDPLRNAHYKEDRRPQTASQNALKSERHTVAASGNRLEIGLFTTMPEHMKPVIDLSKLQRGTIAHNRKAYADAFKHAPKTRAISWQYAAGGADRDGLFKPEDPLRGAHSLDLAKFGDQVVKDAKSKPVQFTKNGFDIYAAPIRFEHAACFSCHPHKKVGDTAAVMAFAFRKG